MRKQNIIEQAMLIIFFIIACLLIVFPFWLLLSVSFSDSAVIAKSGYQLFPNPISMKAYNYVFKNPTQILRAYGITFVFAIVTMVLL